MAFDLKVHHYAKVPGHRIAQLQKVTPYACLTNGDKDVNVPKILLRGGKAWGMNGKEISPVPQWALDKMKDMNKKVLEELGWANKLAEIDVDPKPAPRRRRRRSTQTEEVEDNGNSNPDGRMGSEGSP